METNLFIFCVLGFSNFIFEPHLGYLAIDFVLWADVYEYNTLFISLKICYNKFLSICYAMQF